MKTIIILSGGMDSITLLHKLVNERREVAALSVNYGQRHKRELMFAAKHCEKLKVKHVIVGIPDVSFVMRGSSQTDPDIHVPHGHYAEENMKTTVVPNRNMILLSIAGAFAMSEKFDSIAYAAHKGDHDIYPDCRSEFVDALEKALQLADWHKVSIERPFIDMTKDQILAEGLKLGINYGETHTCYEGNPIACGRCGTCVERLEAFWLNGVVDPVPYRDNEYWMQVSKIYQKSK